MLDLHSVTFQPSFMIVGQPLVHKTVISCAHHATQARGVASVTGRPRRDRSRTTTERGYGHHHQQRRAALLPSAVGQLCSLCGKPMRDGEALDLHHSVPLVIAPGSVGDVIVHAVCNRAGAVRGQRSGMTPERGRRGS
jgi:hypothetical protein